MPINHTIVLHDLHDVYHILHKGVQSKLHEIAKMKYFSSLFTGVKLCPFLNLFNDFFSGDIWSTPRWHQHSEPWFLGLWPDVRSDKLIALKEAFYRQSAPNLTNLFATVAVEQMGGFVMEGCVALIFLLKGGLMLPSFLWRPFWDRSPQKPWIEAKFMLKRSSLSKISSFF